MLIETLLLQLIPIKTFLDLLKLYSRYYYTIYEYNKMIYQYSSKI